MSRRTFVVGAAAVAATLGLATGLAAAQSQPAQTQSSAPPPPVTSSVGTADGVDAMNKMHEWMVAQMPEGLRDDANAMHARMTQVNGGMGALMQSMMGPGAPPAPPGG